MTLRARIPSPPLLKYYLYMGTVSRGFVQPIIVLFVISRGLSYTQLGLVTSAFWVSWTLSEIPSGYIGDRIGRRNSLLIAATIDVVAILSFGLATSGLAFAAVYGLWALGTTFRSGSQDAWLYDILSERDDLGALDETAFAHVRGRGQAVLSLVTAVTALVGGYLGEIGLFYPFIAAALLHGLGLGVLLTLPKTARYTTSSTHPSTSDTLATRKAIAVIRERFTRPPLRAFVVYSALFIGVMWMAGIFIQPIGTDLGLTETELGWLYAGFTGVAALVSYYTGLIEQTLGIRGWFYSMPFIVGVLFVGMAVVPLIALPAFVVMRAANRVTRSLGNQYVNEHVPAVGRATLLSTASMVYAVTMIPVRVIAGLLADVTSPFVAVAAFGGVLVFGSILVLVWEAPVSAADDTGADASHTE